MASIIAPVHLWDIQPHESIELMKFCESSCAHGAIWAVAVATEPPERVKTYSRWHLSVKCWTTVHIRAFVTAIIYCSFILDDFFVSLAWHLDKKKKKEGIQNANSWKVWVKMSFTGGKLQQQHHSVVVADCLYHCNAFTTVCAIEIIMLFLFILCIERGTYV